MGKGEAKKKNVLGTEKGIRPLNDSLHRGEPTGTMVKVESKWDAYLALPEPTKAHKAGILYLPDVLGIWANSKLMADQYAANGYPCLVVDLFNGDALKPNWPAGFDILKWIAEGSDGKNPHTPEAVDPIVEAGIRFLKGPDVGVEKVGAVGYCFGGKV
jgi:dienelactone hydrolase